LFDISSLSQVVVIDMHNGNTVDKKPITADASVMNPNKNIIALKGRTAK
jgi:hypothetical protein